MSSPAQHVPPLAATLERRFYPRIVPQAPIFVSFNEGHESLLLNISENGLLLSTPSELPCNSVARLSISLRGIPKSVKVTARVVWASDFRNLAGIQLLDLSEHDRQLIRSWGAQDFQPSWLPAPLEPVQPSLVVLPSLTSTESALATSALPQTAPLEVLADTVAPARPLLVRTRPASILPRRAMRAALIAIGSLAAAFLLIKAAPGNPFAHFSASHPKSAPIASVIQRLPSLPDNPEISKRDPLSQPPPSAPPSNAATSQSPRGSTPVPQAPPQLEQAAAAPTPAETPSPSTQNSSSATPANATPPLASISETAPAPDPSSPALEEPAPAPPDPSALAPAPPTPAPPITSTIAPMRPASLPKPSAPVLIQMDAPRNQTLDVHLPAGYQPPFFNLPGERVLETPALTIHIQRSVHLPATQSGWPFHRNKKVLLGELIARADPQAAQIPATSANSVRVTATVSRDGRIQNIKSILGPPNLVPAVSQALHAWRYQPTLVDDKPVETQCYLIFQFHPPYRASKR